MIANGFRFDSRGTRFATLSLFFVTTVCLFGQRSIFNTTPQQQMQNYYFQQQQAQAAQERAAAEAMRRQAEIDEITAGLTTERDSKIRVLTENKDATVAGIRAEIASQQLKKQNLTELNAELAARSEHERAKQLFQPQDPWRMLGGQITNAKDKGWLWFRGKVIEVRSDGIMVDGEFGEPLEPSMGKREFFVEDFPSDKYPMADGESIDAVSHFVAHLGVASSIYRYTNSTISLRVETVRKLQYGKIISSPPPDLARKWQPVVFSDSSGVTSTNEVDTLQAQIDALESRIVSLQSTFELQKGKIQDEYDEKIKAVPGQLAQKEKAKKDAKINEAKQKALMSNQEAADRGDVYGLLRMGERYRDGDGVEKDEIKARNYLQKAADAGSPTAEEELKRLPSQVQ